MANMSVITCGECGIEFHVPERWDNARREDHVTFYCPNGHSRVYSGESKAEKLQRELNNAKQQIARAEDEARLAKLQADAAERSNRSLKKRASAGNCPCCKRTFSNMARHMKHQHPEFVAEAGAKVVPMKVRA